jgi:AcrR family transcriptional regulator
MAQERTNAPRTRAKAADTRARLLRAAREAFAELGYPDTRVADIAGRAGTSHGTFYTYFTDKKDVLIALTEDTARSLYGMAVAPLTDDPATRTPQDAVRFRMRAFLDAYRADSRFVRAWMQAAALHPDVDEVRRRIQDSLADTLAGIMARDRERGLIAAEVDVDVAATALTQMTEAFATRWIARGRELDDEIVDQLTHMWMGAVYGPQPASSDRNDDAGSAAA